MQATGSQEGGRNYIAENSRGYQTRGRSLNAGPNPIAVNKTAD